MHAAIITSIAVCVSLSSWSARATVGQGEIADAFESLTEDKALAPGNVNDVAALGDLFGLPAPANEQPPASGLWPTAQGNRGRHFGLPLVLNENRAFVPTILPNGYFLLLYRGTDQASENLYVILGQPVGSFLSEMIDLDLVKSYREFLNHIAAIKKKGHDPFEVLPMHYPGWREALIEWSGSRDFEDETHGIDAGFLYNLRVQMTARDYAAQMDQLIHNSIVRAGLPERPDYQVQSYGVGRTLKGEPYLLYTLKPTTWGEDWMSRWSQFLAEVHHALNSAHQVKIFNPASDRCGQELMNKQKGLN